MLTPLLLLACTAPDWAEARAGCGVTSASGAAWPAASTDEWAELTLDRTCIDTLQDALQLGAVPAGVADEGSLESSGLTQVEGGLWLLLAFELGTYAELRADPDLPGVLAEDLDRFAFADETPGGEVLYRYVTGTITGSEVRDRELPALDNVTDTLLVPTIPSDGLPFAWAAVLVHEAAHAPGTRPHVDCETGRPSPAGPDDTWNGAWGAGLWTLLWFGRFVDDALAPALAHDLAFLQRGAFCEGVEVPDAL